MVFAFIEDGSVQVFGTEAEAVRHFEGIDVESGVVTFYDGNGVFLEPRFVSPNQQRRILGPIGWVVSGVYELVPNSQADADTFALALYEAQSLEPNRWFNDLSHLKAELAEKGVPVEFAGKET